VPVKTFDEVTPAWLTEILTSRGSLISGAVEHIEQKRDLNRVTYNATLHLSYAPNSRGRCPTKLFFKQDHRASEAKFYQSIAPTLTGVVVPTCYDAPYDDLNSHVLLEFVEHTHFTSPETLPISLACHEKVIDALSNVHSQFWDHPRLEDIGTLATDISAFTFGISSQHFGLPASIWWVALECTLSAFEDLQCEEFL
jgi:hypothetical protein